MKAPRVSLWWLLALVPLPIAALSEEKAVTPRQLRRTERMGGPGGGHFEEVAPAGGLLTGLLVYTARFDGHEVIAALQPLFQVADTASAGRVHGRPRSEKGARLEAAPGYAVGGLKISADDRVDGFSVVFRRILQDGCTLDPEDSYESEWIGSEVGLRSELLPPRPVAGIFGADGAELDSLGLVDELPLPTPEHPLAVPQREVTREQPAAVKVRAMSAEPLVEEPAEGHVKWVQIPAALLGARIYSVPEQPHHGVLEFRSQSAGRVYVACNYEYQGDPAGDWTNDRWMPEDFARHGWSPVEGNVLISREEHRYVLFTRVLAVGEAVHLRCNKYEPPYVLTFAQ